MNLIAAVDQNWAIGYQNQLLIRISADLKRFQALTMGHPVLMGRKTLQSLPGGRPLPGRRNFILSTGPDYHVEGAETLHSVEEALNACPEDTFVIGGAQVYRALLPYCDTAYVTRIRAAYPADAWLPDLDDRADWTLFREEPAQEEGGAAFRYCIYRRRE